MGVDLSGPTVERVESMFAAEDLETVCELLENECGSTLPFSDDATPSSLERVRFAALKLSRGDVERLVEAIALAQTDWRDLLVAAGFADDTAAHESWWPDPGAG